MPHNHADDLTPSEAATVLASFTERKELLQEESATLLSQEIACLEQHRERIELNGDVPRDIAQFLLDHYDALMRQNADQIVQDSASISTAAAELRDTELKPAITRADATTQLGAIAVLGLRWKAAAALAHLHEVVSLAIEAKN